jgi:hypothetical protein
MQWRSHKHDQVNLHQANTIHVNALPPNIKFHNWCHHLGGVDWQEQQPLVAFCGSCWTASEICWNKERKRKGDYTDKNKAEEFLLNKKPSKVAVLYTIHIENASKFKCYDSRIAIHQCMWTFKLTHSISQVRWDLRRMTWVTKGK